MADLKVGLKHAKTIKVEPGLTVPEISPVFGEFRDMPPVFATAYMVAFVEATCIEALAPYLEADEGTVGTQINMSHVAATPIGMSVTARVELVTMERRQLLFRAVCRDAKDLIGEGLHERFVINRPVFIARTESKLAPAEC